MFTAEQLKTAHSKVKSGADFPAYVKAIKQLGVTHYETFVSDGHTDYFGKDNYKVTVPAKYPELALAATCHSDEFKAGLKEHQNGKTDYLTFIQMSAATGIEKWQTNTERMTCIYSDKAGNEVLVEEIPG